MFYELNIASIQDNILLLEKKQNSLQQYGPMLNNPPIQTLYNMKVISQKLTFNDQINNLKL